MRWQLRGSRLQLIASFQLSHCVLHVASWPSSCCYLETNRTEVIAMEERVECQNCGTLNDPGTDSCVSCNGPLTAEAIREIETERDTRVQLPSEEGRPSLTDGFSFLPRRLGKAQTVDRWDMLISGAKGQGDGVLQRTEQLVVETEAPDIGMKTQKVSPGLLQGVLGTKRTFLVASVTTNARLKPYRMYISARDYGIQLQVSWYVAFQPGFLLKLLNFLLCVPVIGLLVLPIKSLTAKPGSLLGLDIFDEQDLRACVTNAHHCLLEAVEKLMVDLHQDPSKIDRKSRGFLGIS